VSETTIRAKAPILGLLGLLIAALVALQFSDPESGLLYLAPALLLLGALAFDRYPGERLLAAVARRRRAAPRHEPAAPVARAIAPLSFPRGGVLLALALAGRGPPQ
jgi:hypothetical protein